LDWHTEPRKPREPLYQICRRPYSEPSTAVRTCAFGVRVSGVRVNGVGMVGQGDDSDPNDSDPNDSDPNYSDPRI